MGGSLTLSVPPAKILGQKGNGCFSLWPSFHGAGVPFSASHWPPSSPWKLLVQINAPWAP